MSESYKERTSEQGMAISATIVLFEEPPHSFTGLNSFTNETIGLYPHPPAPTQKKPRRRRNECCEISFLIFYAAVCLFFFVKVILDIVVFLQFPQELIPQNGLAAVSSQTLSAQPSNLSPSQLIWPDNLSGDIKPVQCHSHDDYWRQAPLHEALSLGCIGVEADIWLGSATKELFVGHDYGSLNPSRTLQTLYLAPLLEILRRQNSSRQADGSFRGIFNRQAGQTFTLLVDMKTNGSTTLPVLLEQLQPFLDEGFLTAYDGNTLLPGALTIVSSGRTPFDLIRQLSSKPSNSSSRSISKGGETKPQRIIFYDAPLHRLTLDDQYDATNSAWASAPFYKTIGEVGPTGLTHDQRKKIQGRIALATSKGLKARYWQTPTYPAAMRDYVWNTLMDEGVGLLNVDQALIASQQNWK